MNMCVQIEVNEYARVLITNYPTNFITVLMDKLFRQIVWAKMKLH